MNFFARLIDFLNGAGDKQVGVPVGLAKKHVDQTEWQAMLRGEASEAWNVETSEARAGRIAEWAESIWSIPPG